MAFSQGTSRRFQTTLASLCLLLASGGFVGAGYVNNSVADAAILAAQHSRPTSSASTGAALVAGFNSPGTHGPGVPMSFADTLIGAHKPAAKQILDLTDPTANTPHLVRNVTAMHADIPEISLELIAQVRKDILAAAYQGLGRPYVWGGTSFEGGWDCSGFVQWAYRQAGVALPRTEQWVPMTETRNPQPGDLVVQNPDGPNHWSHIGIYIGGGLMISALNPSVGTILHAPSDVSSSSSYFTMPAFAEADSKAKAAAGPTATGDGASPATPQTSGPAETASTNPGTIPSATPGATSETAVPSTAPSTRPTVPPPVTPKPGGTPSPSPTIPPAVTTKPGGTPSPSPTVPPPVTTKPGGTPSAPETGAPTTKTAAPHPTGERTTHPADGQRSTAAF